MVIDESGESFEIDYTEKTNKRKAGTEMNLIGY